MRTPIASKNSMISFASGAPPEPGMRSRPPKGSRTLLKTSRSAMRCLARSPAGTGLPSLSRRLTSRPIGSAQSMRRRFVPVAASKRATDGRVHLLVHARDARQQRRAHLRQRLGDAQRVGEERDREADVRAEEQHQPPVVVREREVEEHDVVRAVVRLLHPVDDARHRVVVAVA